MIITGIDKGKGQGWPTMRTAVRLLQATDLQHRPPPLASTDPTPRDWKKKIEVWRKVWLECEGQVCDAGTAAAKGVAFGTLPQVPGGKGLLYSSQVHMNSH